jgi:pimeloyl-ACP methyl ester carboxylesterase
MGEAVSAARVDDIDVAYRVMGEGRPLLMIIGLGSSQDLWEPSFVRKLSRDFKVVTFDNRGMGDTPPGTEEFTIERFARDTAGLMDAMGIERAHLLGYSMGGYVAQELALQDPDRIDRLVLLDTEPGSSNGTCIARDVLNHLADMSGTPDDRSRRLNNFLYPQDWLERHGKELKEVFAIHYEHPPDGVAVLKQAAAMCEWKGAYDRLPLLRLPALVIAGGADEVIPPQKSREMAELIAGARFVKVEGGGHGLIFQFPTQLARMIRDFLIS